MTYLKAIKKIGFPLLLGSMVSFVAKAQTSDAERNTSAVESALASGDFQDAGTTSLQALQVLENALSEAVSNERPLRQFPTILHRLNRSVEEIDWNVTNWGQTFDLLSPDTQQIVLNTNGYYQQIGQPFQTRPLAVAGTEGGRYLALGSNPVRSVHRGIAMNAGMQRWFRNAIRWLSGRAPTAQRPLNVVIAHLRPMAEETQIHAWLAEQYGERLRANAVHACDNSALAQCLQQPTDLLILSERLYDGQPTSTVMNALRDARARGIPVMYINFGDWSALGNEILANLNLMRSGYIGDGHDGLIDWTPEQLNGDYQPSVYATVADLLARYQQNDFDFDMTRVRDANSDDRARFNQQLAQPLERLRAMLTFFYQHDIRVFEGESRFWKLLVLWADALRESVVYNNTSTLANNQWQIHDSAFINAFIADHLTYLARNTQPVPSDLGNYSRTDFSHIEPVTRSLAVDSLIPFTSTGIYVLPGQTVTITRNDQSDASASFALSSLRAGATHHFAAYNRPKYVQSPRRSLAPGESVTFSSPYGGPVYIYSDTDHAELNFTFQNVGQHPIVHLNNAMTAQQRNAATDVFYEAVMRNDFDWADYLAPQYQIHSTQPFMVETLLRARLDANGGDMSNGEWYSGTRYESGDGELLYQSVAHYLYSNVLGLAGISGPGVAFNPEIHGFIEEQGWAPTERTYTQHSNHDQALCGAMCSGNPIDSNGFFRPPPQGVGEGHEMGHEVEDDFFITIFEGASYHGLTNLFSEYSNAEYLERNGEQIRGCNSPSYDAVYDEVRRHEITGEPFDQTRISSNADEVGRALFYQVLSAAQDQTPLENGFHLQGRLQAYSRQLSRALANNETWAQQQTRLGLDGFTRQSIFPRRGQSIQARRNDLLLVGLTVTTGYDFRHLFDLLGARVSDDVLAHVDNMDLPRITKSVYLLHETDGPCGGLGASVAVPVSTSMPTTASYARHPERGLAASSVREPWYGISAARLMDGSVATPNLWQGHAPTANEPAWVEYFNINGRRLASYSLSSANVQARDPRDWLLLGSNDGANYVELDRRRGEQFPRREYTNPPYVIPTENRGNYRYYRLQIEAIRGNDLGVAISEWGLNDE